MANLHDNLKTNMAAIVNKAYSAAGVVHPLFFRKLWMLSYPLVTLVFMYLTQKDVLPDSN